jgi:ribonuclease-3
VPAYELVDSVGPDHEKTFTVRVLLSEEEIGRGTSRSRKAAESAAASDALRRVG